MRIRIDFTVFLISLLKLLDQFVNLIPVNIQREPNSRKIIHLFIPPLLKIFFQFASSWLTKFSSERPAYCVNISLSGLLLLSFASLSAISQALVECSFSALFRLTIPL